MNGSLGRNIATNTQTLVGNRRVASAGRPGLGFMRTHQDWDIGIHLASGHKRCHEQLITKPNQAITVGVAAAAGLTINNAVTLDAANVTEDTSITAQPDVPRNLRAVCNQASVGDGTFGAGGKWITIYGTNQFGEEIVESVALNGTTPVFSLNAFATVTQIDYPSRNAGGDTCTVTSGPALALDRPVEAAGDLLEMAVKATAATAYTTTTLPGTLSVGAAYAKLAGDGDRGLITEDSTVISMLTAGITGTFPSAPFIVEIISGNQREVAIVTAVATDGDYTEFTIRRGLCGTAALKWGIGAYVQWVAPMTVSPTITANDRFKFTYLTRAVF